MVTSSKVNSIFSIAWKIGRPSDDSTGPAPSRQIILAPNPPPLLQPEANGVSWELIPAIGLKTHYLRCRETESPSDAEQTGFQAFGAIAHTFP